MEINEIELRRSMEWAENMEGKTCKTCQWGAYEKGSKMVTCGDHIENFSINSSCGAWTSPTDVDFLKDQQENKERLMKKLKSNPLHPHTNKGGK